MSGLLPSPIFWIIAINMSGFIGGYALHSIPLIQKRFFELPRIVQQAFVCFVAGPPLILPFLSQPHFKSFSSAMTTIGIIFCFIGVILELLAFQKIGLIPSLIPPEKKKSEVVDSGVYGLIRHPVYSGVVFLSLGLSLALKAVYALLYVPVIVFLFAIMVVIEEKGLVKYYGEGYEAYRERVRWRLIPFLF